MGLHQNQKDYLGPIHPKDGTKVAVNIKDVSWRGDLKV